MMDIKSGIDLHDGLAASWDERYRRGNFKKRAEFIYNQLLRRVPSGGMWLDAGCGSGYFSRILAQRKARVIGLDASWNMIREARALAVAAGLEAQLDFRKVDTIEKLPFDDETFDGCICLSVLEYLKNPSSCIEEIVRTTKKGGAVILSIPHKMSVVRMAQIGLKEVDRIFGKHGVNYVEFSKFSDTPKKFGERLKSLGLHDIDIDVFDPFIPSFLHPFLPPSMIYVVARR